ncbi:MAG: methyltransferase domain-containing protein [Acidobacteria bacterium]|nr:methyltransferase domain-containing protein [Acidobacteriota bacterium]
MPSQQEWSERWKTGDTPWDLGTSTPALLEFREHLDSGNRVLVPGCGRGHDAHLLWKMGFKVTGIDLAAEALEHAQSQYPHSGVRWMVKDFLTVSLTTKFDAVWEYTSFCAMDPEQRPQYFSQIAKHLRKGGLYGGLVFTKVPNPDKGEPPYQIEENAFKQLLEPHFEIIDWVPAYPKSVKARRGNELWFLAEKK